MAEFLAMGGDGAYVWSAYGITLAALIYCYWSAERRLKTFMKQLGHRDQDEAAARTPRVRQL